MSQKDEESVADKKISRRSLLKYTGALAAGLVVGVAAEYGATFKPPPPPPPSFKPPLSPEIRSKVDAITKRLVDRHAGETIVYQTDNMGCMADNCIVKIRVKDGVIKAIEPDDTINQGLSAREDISLDDLKKGHIQERICTVAHAWRAKIYDPTRILYPMKQVGTRGEDKFARISWTEALDTIAARVKGTKEQYGPYSIYSWALGPQYGVGVNSWGENSHSGLTIEEYLVEGSQTRSTDPPTMSEVFNSKLVVLWGRNPVYIEKGTWPYFLVRAKEAGVPFIVIDPRYSPSAESLNAQWIPIRPGTDLAMALAVANVLLKENLYDNDFVTKWAEPTGFAKFKDYVLGVTEGPDGKIDRTPEWAATLCGVPAGAIREFARLYAKSKPTMMLFGWASCRSMSTNVSRVIIYLSVLTGNLHSPGGGHPYWGGYTKNPAGNTSPSGNWNRATPFTNPVLFNGPPKYPDAILLRDKVNSGEMTAQEYNGIIGNKADNKMLPNIQLMVFGDTCPAIEHVHDSSKRIRAIKKVPFTFGFRWDKQSGEFRYMDIVLPKTEWFEETQGFTAGGAAGLNNYFVYRKRAIKPPGEVRPTEWANLQLAKRLGVGTAYNPVLDPVVGVDEWDADKWDAANEQFWKAAYQTYLTTATNAPTWDDIKTKQVVRFDALTNKGNMSGWVAQGKNPYTTDSGKLEIYSKFLEDPAKVANTVLPSTSYLGCCLGKLGPANTPLPQWHDNIFGTFHDSGVANYPLVVTSPNSNMRHHSAMYGVSWLNGDSYRHACWISVADAKARGIKDGDLVRVHSSVGEMIIPAYVTARTIPGVVSVFHGGMYKPSAARSALMPDGVDRGGNQNFLIEDTQPGRMRIGPTLDAGLCQVEKL